MSQKTTLRSLTKSGLRSLGLECVLRRLWGRLVRNNTIVAIRSIRSRRLRQIVTKINSTSCNVAIDGIAGWLSPNERRALYAVTKWIDGPFLEIGSWAGLSTCHIAQAIRDSGVNKRFITTELNPGLNNFRPCGTEVAFFYPADSPTPRGRASLSLYESEIKPILTAPGGVLGTLMTNLNRFNLKPFVEVREGHFAQVAPKLKYAFIFCDAMHDPDEIDLNAPLLKDLLSPGSILACHDVTRDSQNEAFIRKHLPIGESFVIDSLFVGEIV
jgi:hypothetical protein